MSPLSASASPREPANPIFGFYSIPTDVREHIKKYNAAPAHLNPNWFQVSSSDTVPIVVFEAASICDEGHAASQKVLFDDVDSRTVTSIRAFTKAIKGGEDHIVMGCTVNHTPQIISLG